MYLKAVIDETKDLSLQDARFASILELVADECERGVFYLFKEWMDRKLTGIPTEDFQKRQPRVVYFSKKEYEANDNACDGPKGKIPIHIPKEELVFARSKAICSGVLEQQGLNATTALLTLAAAGIDIALPNVSFPPESVDEILEIRSNLEDERTAYLGVVTRLADDAYDRLASGDFHNIYDWARREATFKILPKARELQIRLRKLDHSLLNRAGIQFWKEGMPAIGKAFVDSGSRSAIRSLAEETIRVLATTLARSIEERRVPEASYILKLSAELGNQ